MAFFGGLDLVFNSPTLPAFLLQIHLLDVAVGRFLPFYIPVLSLGKVDPLPVDAPVVPEVFLLLLCLGLAVSPSS